MSPGWRPWPARCRTSTFEARSATWVATARSPRQHRRAGPRGRCPRDLLLRPVDVRPGDQSHPRPTVPARAAQLQPAGRGRRHGDRASGEPGEQRPRRPRQLARRRQHHAAVADQRQHRSDEEVRDDLEPLVQRAPDRGREGSRQLGGGHVEVGRDPVEVLADGRRLAQSDGVGLSTGHDDRGDPPVDRDVRHETGVGGGQLGLDLLEGRGLADLAAPVAVPALLTDPVAQLVEPSAVGGGGMRGRRRTAPAARSASAACCSSAGGRTGVTRATSARARSDHS